MSFHLGQHVVCIDDSTHAGARPFRVSEAIKKGQIYTVKDVYVDGDDDLILRLVEIERSNEAKAYYGSRVGYLAARFSPLDEARLDIFRQMLVFPPKVEEPSPVVFSDQEPS